MSHLQSFPKAIEQSLAQALVVGYGLEYVAVRGDVTYGPLPEPGAAKSENVAAGLGDAVLLESRLDLVVGQEGHVARVRHSQDLPVPQQRRPWLKQPGGKI